MQLTLVSPLEQREHVMTGTKSLMQAMSRKSVNTLRGIILIQNTTLFNNVRLTEEE